MCANRAFFLRLVVDGLWVLVFFVNDPRVLRVFVVGCVIAQHDKIKFAQQSMRHH